MAPALRMTRIIKEKHKIFLCLLPPVDSIPWPSNHLPFCTSILSTDKVAIIDAVASPQFRTREHVSSAIL